MYLLFMEPRVQKSHSLCYVNCQHVQIDNAVAEIPVRASLATLANSPIQVPGLENLHSTPSINSFLGKHGILAGHMQDVGRLTAFSSEPLDLQDPLEYSLTVKAPGTFKSFKEAKERGDIVVKPLTRVTMSASDQMIVIDPGRLIRSSSITGAGIPGGNSRTTLTCSWGTFERMRNAYLGHPFVADPPPYPWDKYGSHVYGYYRLHTGVSASSLFARARLDLSSVAGQILSFPMPPNLQNETLNELHEGVYDLLTELGELPETVRYIYDSLRRIIQLFIGMKSKEALARKRFKGKELIDELTSLWMSFRYAASPIGYSIEDGLKLLRERDTPYITVRKREDVPFDFDIGEYNFTGTVEHRCFGKARVNLQSAVRGLQLNPAKTIWELTPLSFVVDWVLPIGSFLGALLPPTSQDQRVLTHSRRVRSLTIKHKETGALVANETSIYRNVVLKPRVSLNVGPQFFMNWKRSLDALSLSWGMFLKKYWKS